MNGTDEVGLRLGCASSNGTIRLYTELRSDGLDDSRFVSTEEVDVDLPLCKPPDEVLGSRPELVNQTKNCNGLPVERDRENRSRFLAQFVDSRMFTEVQPSAVPAS